MNNTGLVLEGGGLRGIFSAGILDFFLEKNIEFPYIIGTSMGALNAASYVSKQKGRSFRIPHTYIKDSRYLSLKNLIKEGSYFGMDFIFNKVVNELDPFDFETFENSSQRFISVTANCLNGKAEYFDKIEDRDKMMDILKATSSLPFISKTKLCHNFSKLGSIRLYSKSINLSKYFILLVPVLNGQTLNSHKLIYISCNKY